MNSLPNDILQSTLRFLALRDRKTCLLVCRKWHRVGGNLNQVLARDEWGFLVLKHHQILPARCQQRAVTSAERIAEIDHELSELILGNLATAVHSCDETAQTSITTRMSKLLDAGATNSEIQVDEHADYNLCDLLLGCLVRQKENGISRIWTILVDLICSPCTSWRHHRWNTGCDIPSWLWRNNRNYYGWNGCPLPWFLYNFVLFGDPRAWGPNVPLPPASFAARCQAWRVLQLMLYSAHSDGSLASFLEQLSLGFYTRPKYLMSPTSNFFLEQFAGFMREFPDETVWSVWMSRQPIYALYYLLSLEQNTPTIRIENNNNDLVAATHHPKNIIILPWHGMLCALWSSHYFQRFFVRQLQWRHTLRVAVLEHCLEALCRRKDRKVLELLFCREAHMMVTRGYLANAILWLEGSRGKTERLLVYFQAIQATSQQRERVLNELTTTRAIVE